MMKQPDTVVTPYNSDDGKKQQVARMFDNIAGNYDFLNHFLSAGIDVAWRRKATRLMQHIAPRKVLDVATGTGDFAIEIARTLKPEKVVGIDISEGMLNVGKQKIEKLNLQSQIELQKGDSEKIAFDTNTFNAVTVAFGVRNYENLKAGLAEMYRVLAPKGMVVILEFSKPRRFPIKQFYNFYFFNILPLWGKLISRDSSAYTYLPLSVDAFPDGDRFINIMHECGFVEAKEHRLTFGIASIYTGYKQ